MVYVIIEWVTYHDIAIVQDTDKDGPMLFDMKSDAVIYGEKEVAFNYKVVEVK